MRGCPSWANPQARVFEDTERAYGKATCERSYKPEQSNIAPQDVLAMVYAPKQEFKDIYEPCKALTRGTVFAQLDLPFCPKC